MGRTLARTTSRFHGKAPVDDDDDDDDDTDVPEPGSLALLGLGLLGLGLSRRRKVVTVGSGFPLDATVRQKSPQPKVAGLFFASRVNGAGAPIDRLGYLPGLPFVAAPVTVTAAGPARPDAPPEFTARTR